MARTLNRLRTKQVEALGPGRHADGGGLYLSRDEHGRSRWLFMWSNAGRRREMGLGAAGKGGVSLAAAREAAARARDLLQKGLDPIEARKAAKVEPTPAPTFGELATEYISAHTPDWRNKKHRGQWTMTLEKYGANLLPMSVDKVDTDAVLDALKPIWTTKPETASRLRGRVERVLNAARAKGHRTGENPAQWRGHLDQLLSAPKKLSRGHHAAMPYAEVAAFLSSLRERDAASAYALEFLILTAARSGEVLGATWDEIDLENKVWTVPGERMKAGREHRVPLTGRAIKILRAVEPLALGPRDDPDFSSQPLFPGQKGRLSGAALSRLMERMKVDDFTVHGFRSSFRDWAGEVSSYPRELAEAALAHTVGNATERAYRRGDALDKRRKLMEAWAGYVEPRAVGANVVKLAGRQRRAYAACRAPLVVTLLCTSLMVRP